MSKSSDGHFVPDETCLENREVQQSGLAPESAVQLPHPSESPAPVPAAQPECPVRQPFGKSRIELSYPFERVFAPTPIERFLRTVASQVGVAERLAYKGCRKLIAVMAAFCLTKKQQKLLRRTYRLIN